MTSPLFKQRMPTFDLILAVENIVDFHKENLNMNKHHYTYMARFTNCKVVNFFQEHGAKVHFNHMQVRDEYLDELSEG